MEPHIFRSYDIRGIYGRDLNEEIMERIGNAFGAKTHNCVVANDARVSSPSLRKAFIKGAAAAGVNVTEIVDVPLGIGMFHAWQRGMDYAYITASHLTKEWNGVKFFHANGMGFMENENMEIRDIAMKNQPATGSGSAATADRSKSIEEYQRYLLERLKPAKRIKIVMDCGNGMAGPVAPNLFKRAGFSVKTIFENVDCTFPNRDPEPSRESLTELSRQVIGSDMGIAYDGDGDRMTLVDETGALLDPVQVSYLILKELLKTESGPIVANVETSKIIDKVAGMFGRNVIRVPVGHTFMVEAVHRHKACFGVEPTGHYCVPSIVPYDDSLAISLYAAAVASISAMSSIVKEVPTLFFGRVNIACDDSKKFIVMKRLAEKLQKEYDNTSTMDGVRIDFGDSWVLLRASNTAPIIRLTVEAETRKRFEELNQEFSSILKKAVNNGD